MNVTSAQLAELLEELHEVNQELVELARPLQWVSTMGLNQRQQLGDQLRGGLARWDNVSERISKLLANGSEGPPSEKAPGTART